MTRSFPRTFLAANSRKVLVYYGGYCCLFLFFYLALVSTISFFHFLLDHELSVIEAWLSHNAWEVLALSKAMAAAITLKTLEMNNYLPKSGWDLVRGGRFVPQKEALAICLFLPVLFAVMAMQFNGAATPNPAANHGIVSYAGSSLFFLFDAFVLYCSLFHFSVEGRRQVLLLGACLIGVFLVASQAALPYQGSRGLYLVLHFACLLIFLGHNHKRPGNLLAYCLLVVGPMAAFLGVDGVWLDAFSAYRYPAETPWFGTLLLWLSAFVYYLRRAPAGLT